MKGHPRIVAREECKSAREKLPVKEKEHTRFLVMRWRRSGAGRPWMAVEKEYGFEGPDGSVSLTDLFEGRRQLIVYCVFYGWRSPPMRRAAHHPQRACVGCSLLLTRSGTAC